MYNINKGLLVKLKTLGYKSLPKMKQNDFG